MPSHFTRAERTSERSQATSSRLSAPHSVETAIALAVFALSFGFALAVVLGLVA